MKRKLTGLLFFLIVLATAANAQTTSVQEKGRVNIVKWVNTHFAKGKIPPFSFNYGGTPSSKFIAKWKYAKSTLAGDEQGGVKTRYTYTDPQTGLEVICDVTTWADFDAVQWILGFKNTGSKNTPALSEVKENNINFRFAQNGLALHYANGSFPSRSDFAPKDKDFKAGDSLVLVPRGGRSSGDVLPFFNLEAPAAHQGVVMGIGWTGKWKAMMTSPTNKDFTFQSGINTFDSYLEPGEQIRTCSVVLCFWNSVDRFDGNNKFRRLIMAHHTRKINGKSAIYPIYFGFSWGDPAPCNEYSCLTGKMALALLERQKMFDLKAEASWIDAGWYTGADDYANGKWWMNTVGNWTINKEHFPNGLKEVSDELHKMGRKLMVWFEPERVYKGTIWDKEHPDWLMKIDKKESRLFNLGNEEACNWLCKYIGDLMQENGIDLYRQDFNIHPDAFWTAYDKPGRQGMTEIKYIMGLYKYWDYLLQRFPETLIDNCASGGMRLDWETTLRSAPMWRTDDCYYNDPSDMQCHTYGINLFLPQSGTGMGLPNRTDKVSLRSSMGSSVVYNWKIMNSSEDFNKTRACQKEFSEVRPYFLEDYYPLTGTKNTDARDNWLVYQLHKPADQSGYIVAFRHHDNKEENCTVGLHALLDGTTYVVTDKDSVKTYEKSGRELKQALQLKLKNPDSSMLLFYKAK